MKDLTYHMRRLTSLASVATHPWLGRVWKKLSLADTQMITAFAEHHRELDFGAFDQAVQRMHLDMPDKPQRWKEIQEVLMCANSAALSADRAKETPKTPQSV